MVTTAVEMEPSTSSANGTEENGTDQRRRSRLSVGNFPRDFFNSFRRKKSQAKNIDQPGDDPDPGATASTSTSASAAPEEEGASRKGARPSRSLSLNSLRLKSGRKKSVEDKIFTPKRKSSKVRSSIPPQLMASAITLVELDDVPGGSADVEASTSDAADMETDQLKDKLTDISHLVADEDVPKVAEAQKPPKKGKVTAKSAVEAVVQEKETLKPAAKNTKSKSKPKGSDNQAAGAVPRDLHTEAAATHSEETTATNEVNQPANGKEKTGSLRRDFLAQFSSFRRKKNSKVRHSVDISAASPQMGESPIVMPKLAEVPKPSRSLSLNSLRLKKGTKSQNKSKATPVESSPSNVPTMTEDDDVAAAVADHLDQTAESEKETALSASEEMAVSGSSAQEIEDAKKIPKDKSQSRDRSLFGSLRRKKKSAPSDEESRGKETPAVEAVEAEASQEAQNRTRQKKFNRSFSFNSMRNKNKSKKTLDLLVPVEGYAMKKSASSVTFVSVDEASIKDEAADDEEPSAKSSQVKFNTGSTEINAAGESEAAASETPVQEGKSSKGKGKVSVGILKNSPSKAASGPLSVTDVIGHVSSPASFGGKLKLGTSSFARDSMRLKKVAPSTSSVLSSSSSSSSSASSSSSSHLARKVQLEAQHLAPVVDDEVSQGNDAAEEPAAAAKDEVAKASPVIRETKAKKTSKGSKKSMSSLAENTDNVFLKGIMESPQKQSAAKVLNTCNSSTPTTNTTTADNTTTVTTTAS